MHFGLLTPFGQSLAIFPTSWGKTYSSFRQLFVEVHICAKLRTSPIWSIKPRISRGKFFDTSAEKFTSLFDRNASTLSARAKTSHRYVRKDFLPENIFYLLVMKASTCHHLWGLDKEVLSSHPLQTAGGILQLSNGCGLNLVPESWHKLFLHTRLPF